MTGRKVRSVGLIENDVPPNVKAIVAVVVQGIVKPAREFSDVQGRKWRN